MPTLYIHTGLHKTGTTSLQKAFFDNRAALARQNVLYPDAGLSQKPFNWGHHELAYAMRRRAGAQALWQSLRDEADASGLDKILVSSEELSLLPFPHFPGAEPYKLIAKIFEGYEIRHITYLRPQAELICSLYNHNVKAVGERRDILEFIADVTPRLEYQHYLNVAALGLGVQSIIVRRYTPQHLIDSDIISDIADLTGIDLDNGFDRPKAPLNPGLSSKGLEAMLLTNRRYAEQPLRLQAERKRIIAQHPASAFHRPSLLTDEARSLIEALYLQKNRMVARRYLGSDEELFTPEPDMAPASAISES